MRRFEQQWVPAAALLVLMALEAPVAGAVDVQKENEIGAFLGAGFADRAIVGEKDDDRVNPLVGLRYSRLACDGKSAFFTDATWVEYESSPPYGDTEELAFRFGGQRFFGSGRRTDWFVEGGLGMLLFDPEIQPSSQRGMLSIGIGQRVSLRGNSNFQWIVRNDFGIGGSGYDDAHISNLKALVGWSFGFGPRPKDSDGDGVKDCTDSCGSTPARATVDAKGCPTDSDGDGVYDGIDQCPDTPKGWPVDAKGCPTDDDDDGVPDGKDSCPNTPRGARVDAKGCPTDSDGDGVYDGLDKCPDTPRGARVDGNGCPLDSDGDGVYDGLDKCPDTPRGTKVDANGCPVEVKAPPVFEPGKKSLVLEGVNFEYDAAVLTPESLAVLDRVAASLRDWPEVGVEIGGHTDARGSDVYNQKLSERRAQAVKEYLESKGIGASRVTVQGYGEKRPVADNTTDEGRARNRRVELTKLD